MSTSFRAFVAAKGDDTVDRSVRELTTEDLPDGDVTIRVAWSSVNFKDGLATIPQGKVAQISPLVPGVDLAGEVVDSDSDEVAPGAQVIAHGYDLGVSRHGGYAEYARVPAGWVVALPDGLDARQAMAIGTAGYTAGLSVHLLEEHGLGPGDGHVLVTGASGGVGSCAVGMLAERGYQVVASSGKEDAHDWLRRLGADEVVGRDAVEPSGRPLEKPEWVAAVDCVGGDTLAGVLSRLSYGGAVAASGNTGGFALETTVLPFILRGVALLGADSANTPIDRRRQLWGRLATDLRPRHLDEAAEVDLDGVEQALDTILEGASRGRTVVRVTG
ncbi:oxidoreductase [soil metagenome]